MSPECSQPPRIACAVASGLRQYAHHHPGRAHQDLPGSPGIAIGCHRSRTTRRSMKMPPQPHFSGLRQARCCGHHRRVSADLGLTVDLADRDVLRLVRIEQLAADARAAGGGETDRRQIGVSEPGATRDGFEEGRHGAEAIDPLALDQRQHCLGHELRLHVDRAAGDRVLDELHEPTRGVERGEADDPRAGGRCGLLESPSSRHKRSSMRCVKTTPFGFAVEPDVAMMTTGASGSGSCVRSLRSRGEVRRSPPWRGRHVAPRRDRRIPARRRTSAARSSRTVRRSRAGCNGN